MDLAPSVDSALVDLVLADLPTKPKPSAGALVDAWVVVIGCTSVTSGWASVAVVLARDASVVVAGGAYVVVAAGRAFGCTDYVWWRFSAQWGCWSIGSFHSWCVSGRSFSDNGYTLHGSITSITFTICLSLRIDTTFSNRNTAHHVAQGWWIYVHCRQLIFHCHNSPFNSQIVDSYI